MKTYSDLSVQNPAIPEASTLYNLSPRNANSGWVESLTGYLLRLAQEHHVVPKVLVQKVIREEYETDESLGSVYKKAYLANGFGDVAEKWSHLLNKVTGRSDLEHLTVLPLRETISNRHFLRDHKAWCSDCLNEWLMVGEPLYEPLLWQLESIMVCPHHRSYLETDCPECEGEVPILTGRSRVGICPHCGSWLGTKRKVGQNIGEQEWWIAIQARGLISMLQNGPDLAQDVVAQRITRIVEGRENLTVTELARRMNGKKNTVWSWSKGKSKPTLRNLLKIGYVLNLSIDEFLEGGFKTNELEVREWEQSDEKNRKSPQSVNTEKLQEKLRDALRSGDDPPSLRQVAQQTPHQPRILREHFPDRCRQISERYKNHRRKKFQKNTERVKREVQETSESLHEEGIYPSKARIEQNLPKAGYFQLPEVREIWKKTLDALGYSP